MVKFPMSYASLLLYTAAEKKIAGSVQKPCRASGAGDLGGRAGECLPGVRAVAGRGCCVNPGLSGSVARLSDSSKIEYGTTPLAGAGNAAPVRFEATTSQQLKFPRIADHLSLSRDLDEDSSGLMLLGGWALWRGGKQVRMSLSAQRLCVLLALHGGQRRSYLAGMLWPDVRDGQALTRLRCALSRLRRQHDRLIEIDGQIVALHPSVRVDVNELKAVARDVIASRIGREYLGAVCDQLVDPPELLLGWYEDWVLQERDRINQLRLRALEALVDQLLEAGEHHAAFEAATAAIRIDPLRESTHRAMMRVHLAEGNPALAGRQVKQYREILRAEIGIGEPTPEMLALVNLRDGPGAETSIRSESLVWPDFGADRD